MKLVIFGEALTYPAKEGLSFHVMSLLSALSKDSRVTPILLLSDRGLISHHTIRSFPWKTVLIPPEQFYDYSSMRGIIDDQHPDAIQSYNVYQARLIAVRYAQERNLPFIMEHHDSEAELAAFLGLPKHASEANIRYQSEAIECAALNRFLSPVDASTLSKLHPNKRRSFLVLPTMIRDDFENLSFTHRQPHHVLFIGNGGYPPNARALKYITTVLAPALEDFTFHLVGRGTEVLRGKNIIGYGRVDNLNPIVEKTSIGVAPLEVGSGLKIKVLHYQSAGMSVVATPTALSGIEPHASLHEAELASFATTLRAITKKPPTPEAIRTSFMNRYVNPQLLSTLITRYLSLTSVPSAPLRPIDRDDSKLAWANGLEPEQLERPVGRPLVLGGSQ